VIVCARLLLVTDVREHLRARRARMWMGPRPHGAVDPDRVVGPLELFYDLVVVVLVGQAAHHLAVHLTWRGTGEFACLFGLVWLAWMNGTLMHDLHGRDDVGSRVRVFAQMLVLTVMATQVERAPESGGRAFALSAAVLFGLLAVLWWWVARGDEPHWRPITRTYITGTTVVAVLLAASSTLTAGWRVASWGALVLAFCAMTCVTVTLTGAVRRTPLTVTDSIAERFGLFVIIVLGEVFVGVVDGLAAEDLHPRQIATALLALTVGFGAWWSYFDLVAQTLPRARAGVSVVWMFAHLPLAGGVAAGGASMVALVEHAGDGRAEAGASFVLAAGTAVLLVASALCLLLRDDPPVVEVTACVGAGVACLVVGAARPAPWALALGLVLVLAVPWVVAVLRGTVMSTEP
jgi:low temperature requirement protein LtrA